MRKYGNSHTASTLWDILVTFVYTLIRRYLVNEKWRFLFFFLLDLVNINVYTIGIGVALVKLLLNLSHLFNLPLSMDSGIRKAYWSDLSVSICV